MKVNPDTYNKYNLRSKIEFPVTKWARFSNNTSLYSTSYKSQGNGSIEDTFGYSANGAFACYPNKNPDGTWIYSVPYQSTKMANGRHIMIGEGSHRNLERNMSFINTSRFIVTPIKPVSYTHLDVYKRQVMELIVIEKSAYLRLKQQVKDLSVQVEAVKKKFGTVKKMCIRDRHCTPIRSI